MNEEEKKMIAKAKKIAKEVLSKAKPRKERCMHCFGELDNPLFCHRVKGHKGQHSARLYWGEEE